MGRHKDRGFSLIVVLMAVLFLAVAATAGMALSGSEAGIASGRARRQQALDAAEAGLRNLVLVATPSSMGANQDLIGSAASNNPTSFVYLPGLDTNADGTVDTQLRYRAFSTAGNVGVMGAGLATVEGQVLTDGQVASSVRLQVVMRVLNPNCQYPGQVGGGAQGRGAPSGCPAWPAGL